VLLANTSPINGLPLAANETGLFIDGRHLLSFRFAHAPKPHLAEMFATLNTLNIHAAVFSGDGAARPEFIPEGVSYSGGCLPDDKAARLQTIQANAHTLFIGDGINDLSAMATADVSMTMFSGAAETKSLADFTLYQPSLLAIPELIAFAKDARQRILINLIWAASYNAIGMSLAAFGLLHPLMAIGFMTISSGFVTLNSLRLLNSSPTLDTLAQPSLKSECLLISECGLPIAD
jgi:P-type Cu+ transporter